jgi:hypothetical protein
LVVLVLVWDDADAWLDFVLIFAIFLMIFLCEGKGQNLVQTLLDFA